jgi:hypothetical protein
MANQKDARDWVIMALVTLGWIAATVFLFTHPATVNFATWSGLTATICGVYHYLCVDDDKRVDAGNVTAALPTEGLEGEIRDWKGGEHVSAT